jgi:hypothetical protein
MDTNTLDQETDAGRNARHRSEMKALFEKLGPEPIPGHELGGWPNEKVRQRRLQISALGELHRLEWYEHPTQETIIKRDSERLLFTPRSFSSSDDDEPKVRRPRMPRHVKGNEPAHGVGPTNRRGR